MEKSPKPDPRETGARLREARRAAGATQQEIASRLGMARTTLVAIEAGQRPAAPNEIMRFAEIYGRSVSDLVRPTALIAPPVARFRATPRANTPDHESEAALAENTLDRLAADYAELELLLDAPPVGQLPPEYHYGLLSPDRAGETAAAAERNRMGTGDGPLGALRQRLANEMGVRIFVYPMASAIAGLFFYHPRLGPCVGVNAKHPPERRRWTLAHEFAHLLFSRHRSELTLLRSGARARPEELLADAFARHFLMPAPGLRRRVSELQAQRGSALSVADACRLAQLYDVSVQAMILRLEDLRLIPAGTWDKLLEQGFQPRSAQATLGIAPPADGETALPERYVQLAAEAYRQQRISEEQLSAFLRTDRVAARAMIEQAAQVQNEAGGVFAPVSVALDQRLC